jgi:hypothetical protein
MKNGRKTEGELIRKPDQGHHSVTMNDAGSLQDVDIFCRLAIEKSRKGIVIASGDRRLFFNWKYLELSGCRTSADLDGKPFLSVVHPDDLEGVKEIISLPHYL